MIDTDVLAREIYEAEQARRTIDPLTERFPDLDLVGAYAVQSGYSELRRRSGAVLVGAKIGCTSKAMQRYFGIDRPDFGILLADMQLAEGEPLSRSELIQPKVEPELAFILGRDLAGPGVTADDALAATEYLAPCFEIIDSRIHDWRIRFEDTVADNGSSARFVLGTPVPPAGVGDLSAVGVVCRRNDEDPLRADGAAVLGNPVNAVAWLANTLGTFGTGLRAGDIVLSGSFTAAMDCAPGDAFRASFSGVGEIRLSVRP